MEENKNNSDIKIEEIDNLQSSKNKIDDKNIKKIKNGNLMVFIISIISIVFGSIAALFLILIGGLSEISISSFSSNSTNAGANVGIGIILLFLILFVGVCLMPSIFMLIYSNKIRSDIKNIEKFGKVTAILAVVFGSIDVFMGLLILLNGKFIFIALISLGISSVLLAGGIIMLVGLSNIKKNLEKNK